MLRALRIWFLLHNIKKLQDDIDHYNGVIDVGSRKLEELLFTIEDREKRIAKLSAEVAMLTPRMCFAGRRCGRERRSV